VTKEELKIAKRKYNWHKQYTKSRIDKLGNEIKFKLTFEEWITIWLDSGQWENRGVKSTQYCMCRYNDIGHYEVGNVFIQQTRDNILQGNTNGKRMKSPAGIFHSLVECAKFYNRDPATIAARLKSKPTEYYYL